VAAGISLKSSRKNREGLYWAEQSAKIEINRIVKTETGINLPVRKWEKFLLITNNFNYN
jgi:hypothetical protein